MPWALWARPVGRGKFKYHGRMHFLHLNNRYWPTWGGAESYVSELSVRLVAEGHAVTLLTTDALDYDLLWNPGRRRVSLLDETHEGVRIKRFRVKHLPGSPAAYMGWRTGLRLASQSGVVPTAWLARLARYTPWVPDLWQWLDTTREPVDLVLGVAVLYEPLIMAGLKFARQRGVPFVYCPLTHLGAGSRPGQDPTSRYYSMRHQLALARDSDAVLCMTATERDFLLARGVLEQRLHVIGAGVNPPEAIGGDADRFRRQHGLDNGPIVGFVSTLMPDKGAAHLVEAVRRLWQAGHEVHLVLAGRPTALFDRYLATLPEADRRRICVLGYVSEAEKRDLLAAADIFAMPSRTDSFGIVYLEAWLNHKPVIAARAWGMADVVAEGEDGLLVPFGDVPALAEALAWLLAHPEERARMGARGAEKVYARHTWDRVYEQIRGVYSQLLGHF